LKKVYLERLPDDWKAEWVAERLQTVMMPDGSNAVHRIQTIMVRRGDCQYYERHDLGDESLYDHEPMYIFSLGQSSVGRVREMAERERERSTLAQRYGFEVPDYKSLYIQYAEELWKQRKGISTFGARVRRRTYV
jgi:hypothetical protein